MGSPGSLMREVGRSKGEDAQPAQAPGCGWYGILTRMRNSPRPVRGGWASEASISTGAQGSTFITTRLLAPGPSSLASDTPSLPNPPSAESRLYAPEPWTIHHNNPGPVTLTLRRSHTRCTLLRRRTSPDFSLARYSMVRPRIRRYTPVDSFSPSVACNSRCCDDSVLPVYWSVVQPCQPYRERSQVGPGCTHHGHVLVHYGVHCNRS